MGTEGYLLESAARPTTELKILRETSALFPGGWCGICAISTNSATNPSIIELPLLSGLDATDTAGLQSTREGNRFDMLNKLTNLCFSISSIKLIKGVSMVVENLIDDLIEAGRYVLESDFDLKALSNWRKEAFQCVSALMGPDHTCTQYFKDFVNGGARTGVLAGEGILNTVKEQLGKVTGRQPCC
jgi:hypothetical protein